MAIALSDYLTWLRAQSPAPTKPAKGRSADRQDGGQAQGDPAPNQPDFSMAGRVALAESSIPGAFFGALGTIGGLPGKAIAMGFTGQDTPFGRIPGLLDQNQNLVNQLTEQEYAQAQAMGNQNGRLGETPGPYGYAAAAGWGLTPPAATPPSFQGRTGIGLDDPTPPAPTPPDFDDGGMGGTPGGTGTGPSEGATGTGGGFMHTGGPVKDVSRAAGGNEPITAQQGEFVVARGPAAKYRKLLEAINADDPARIKRHATLKEALTR